MEDKQPFTEFSTMVANYMYLLMQGARASAAMALTKFAQNIMVASLEEFSVKFLWDLIILYEHQSIRKYISQTMAEIMGNTLYT